MSNSGKLNGLVAIITGAASGMGRAAAIEFAQQGAKICVADVNEAGGAETVRRVEAVNGQAFFQHCDVSSAAAAEAMVRATVERFGAVHILYNNAAATMLCNTEDRPVTELPEWVWDKMLAICLKGVYLCSKFSIPEIIKAGGGCVINTTSCDAILSEPGFDSYTAAKGGVIAMTRSMAAEYGAQKVRVNCIAPGYVATECQESWMRDPVALQTAAAMHCTRIGQPEDVARFAAFLAAPGNDYITGGIFPVDGGFTAFKAPLGVIDFSASKD